MSLAEAAVLPAGLEFSLHTLIASSMTALHAAPPRVTSAGQLTAGLAKCGDT